MGVSTFYIIKKNKKSKNSKAGYVARFVDDLGKTVRQISLPEAKSKAAARAMAEKIMQGGIVSNQNNPEIISYLLDFWTRGSDYEQGKKLRGRTLSEVYLKDNRRTVKLHLKPYLEGRRLLDIGPDQLESVILALSRKGISNRRINIAVQCLKVPYGHFCKMKRIPNPLTVVDRLHEDTKERGILTLAEIKNIIALKNEDPRSYGAVILAALCGLRLGEIRGMQWGDIDEENAILTVQHNFIRTEEGVKGPKWGGIRQVPIPGPAMDALKVLRDISPGGVFVFYNEKGHSIPCRDTTITAGFRRILKKIGIDDEARRTRNIVFHSLRHSFVSLSRAGGIPDFLIMRLAGHRSAEMMERYTHSEGIIDFKAARETMERQLRASGEGKS